MGTSATLREIFQMSPISSKSLNGANSGSRGPREEVKKGKSSEFNPQNDGQVKSRQALKIFEYEGSNLYSKYCQHCVTKIGARPDKTSNKLLLGPKIFA